MENIEKKGDRFDLKSSREYWASCRLSGAKMTELVSEDG